MNKLPNGCIAVGSPGSFMRLLTAYEYELERDWDSGKCFLWTRDRVPEMARKMMDAATVGNALVQKDSALARAAIACDIKPTAKSIQRYLIAAGA